MGRDGLVDLHGIRTNEATRVNAHHISLDTETSGLSHSDELTSFYAVEFDMATGALGKALQLDFNPGVPISYHATLKTGQTNEIQAKFPKLALAHCIAIADFLKGAEVWIHNKSFDERFINKCMQRFQLPALAGLASLRCSVQRARELGHKESKLDVLCDYYRIDRSNRTLHGARIDAELLAMVVSHMQRPKPTSMREARALRA